MIKAKPLLKNKFWIVEDNGERIGTIAHNDDKYVFTGKSKIEFFDNKKQIKHKLGNIIWDSHQDNQKSPTRMVYDYPCAVTPYNLMYDVKRKLPLFTKSIKSKSLYCAGYYIIKFDKGWVKSFCPKLITVERYDYKGPFKTRSEMKSSLSLLEE